MTRVLPVPAPASTSRGPSKWVAPAFCSGFSFSRSTGMARVPPQGRRSRILPNAVGRGWAVAAGLSRRGSREEPGPRRPRRRTRVGGEGPDEAGVGGRGPRQEREIGIAIDGPPGGFGGGGRGQRDRVRQQKKIRRVLRDDAPPSRRGRHRG